MNSGDAEFGARLIRSGVVAVAAAREGKVVYANQAFGLLFGQPGMAEGTTLFELVSEQDRKVLESALREAQERPSKFIGLGRRATGGVFEVELNLAREGNEAGSTLLLIAEDASERRRAEAQLSSLAFIDSLTSLPNRALLTDRLQQAWVQARRAGSTFAVLTADLDGFKAVNDTWGHKAGDVVLQRVAQRFLGCVRETDTVARLGGDEFAVLLTRLKDPEDAAIIAGRMVRGLEEAFEFEGKGLKVGTSVGIALYPEHGADVDALMGASDGAMYQAKKEGKNRFCWAGAGQGHVTAPLPFVTWSEAHAVGVEEIDEHHQHLVGLINRVGGDLKNAVDVTVPRASLEDLVRFTEFHFASEERLIAQHAIVESKGHRDMHRKLLDDMQSLSLSLDGASISLTMRYLQVWLLRHVDSMDKVLGRALNARGVK